VTDFTKLAVGTDIAEIISKRATPIIRNMNHTNSILIENSFQPSQLVETRAIQISRPTIAAWTCFLLSGAALLTALNFALF